MMLWDHVQEVRSLSEVQQLAQLNSRISLVVHEIQKERGRTGLVYGKTGRRAVELTVGPLDLQNPMIRATEFHLVVNAIDQVRAVPGEER